MPEGPETARADFDEAMVLERDSVPLSEKNRRADGERLGGGKFAAERDNGGELGPRRAFRRARPSLQSVNGWVCDSPIWPQPLCEV